MIRRDDPGPAPAPAPSLPLPRAAPPAPAHFTAALSTASRFPRRFVAGSGWDELAAKGATGCAIAAVGQLVKSPAAGQSFELGVRELVVVGSSDGAAYPLAKKAHTLEHLRSLTHLSAPRLHRHRAHTGNT